MAPRLANAVGSIRQIWSRWSTGEDPTVGQSAFPSLNFAATRILTRERNRCVVGERPGSAADLASWSQNSPILSPLPQRD
jgi:hypothetical protein